MVQGQREPRSLNTQWRQNYSFHWCLLLWLECSAPLPRTELQSLLLLPLILHPPFSLCLSSDILLHFSLLIHSFALFTFIMVLTMSTSTPIIFLTNLSLSYSPLHVNVTGFVTFDNTFWCLHILNWISFLHVSINIEEGVQLFDANIIVDNNGKNKLFMHSVKCI